jgi:serine/threonine protein kinase
VDALQRLALEELSAEAALRLQQHLVRCPECARLAHDLKDAACLLRAVSAGAGSTPSVAAFSALTPTPPPSSHGEYGFLSPPQAVGELGRLGPYAVRRVIGSGGMGLVLEAEDPHLERPVALKIMHAPLVANESYRQRFLQEARAAAKLDHENIVTIYGAGEERGVLYLAMQFLRGETLDDRLRHEGRLPLADVLRIGREVAAALAAAHDHGLVHRDVKPANIWLEAGSGRVKMLDFGLARVSGANAARLTGAGVVMGTPGYMAPEQARARSAVDHRCDLFSLGCVLYHASTGRQAFDTSDPVSSLIALATERPLPPHQVNADVPEALSDLVMRLLEKKPADRPAQARLVVEELTRIERGEVRSPVNPPPAPGPIVRAAKVSSRESVLLLHRAARKTSAMTRSRRRLGGALVAVASLVLVAAAALAVYHFGPAVGRFVTGSHLPVSQPEP